MSWSTQGLRDPEPASDLAGCCVGAFPDCSLKLTILFVCLFDPFVLRRESQRLGKKPLKKLMTLWSVRTGGGEGWWKDENQLADLRPRESLFRSWNFPSTDVLSGLSSPRKSWIFADSVVQFLVLCVGLKVAQRVVFISALLSRRKVGVRNKLELQNPGKARPFIALPDAYSDGLLHERSLSLFA